MFKFIKKSSFILTFLLGSFVVNANLMQLTNNDYITVDHGNNNLIDWAWASSNSVEYYYVTEMNNNGLYETTLDNHFFAPETVTGWRVATTDEFNYFLGNIFLSDFTNSDGSYITAHSFWNTNDSVYDSGDFSLRDITSEWIEDSVLDYNQNLIPNNYWFDTFYVRTHSADPQPVPEPSTLMIFALGLIAFASKNKAFLKSIK